MHDPDRVKRFVHSATSLRSLNELRLAGRDKVKADFAPVLMQDALGNALRDSNFETPESAPIRAHIVLDEFTSGSAAKRFVVGMGAGRSTVDGRLVIQGEDGKELANTRIRVWGKLAWSAYQGAIVSVRKPSTALMNG
jgi:hypothetical protein